MTDMPRYRRDYSREELDARPLIMLRTFAPSVLVWTGARPQTLKDYLEQRLAENRAATAYPTPR